MKNHSRLALLAVAAAIVSISAPGTSSAAYFRHSTKPQPIDYKNERIVRKAPCCRVVPPTLRDGIYLGVGLGYDSYRFRQSINILDANNLLDTANPAISGRGVVGDVFAGYGQFYEWFYIAGEIFTKYTSTNSGYKLNNYNSDFTIRQTFGVSILPGVRVNRATMIYTRFGYSRTFMKAQENGTIYGNVGASNWGNGIDLGLGAEIAIFQNFSARGEYTYTNYSSFRSKLNTKFSASNSEVILGLNYHFFI